MTEKKRVLIVRSASFQQLDSNLISIKERFADWELHILTHEHGRKLAEKYRNLSCIRIYPYQGPFESKRVVKGWESWNYDAVVVLVANLSGVGYVNVFGFASILGAGELYMCNKVGDIRCLKAEDLAAIRRRDMYSRLSGATLGTALAIAGAAWFLFCFPVLRLIYPRSFPNSRKLMA